MATPVTAAAYITCMVRDAATGDLWVGSEQKGLWRCHTDDTVIPSKRVWTHFATPDGLGDDTIYALAIDKRGRVWVGQARSGVSVYNGREWRNYGPTPDSLNSLNSLLGHRVFAIAVNPQGGDVWIATETGLTRYAEENKNQPWTYVTRADGLPSQQISALAFGPEGNLYVGFQVGGLAIATAKDDYKTWKHIPGVTGTPNYPSGHAGPPFEMTNCLLASQTPGTVYVGTPDGLAISTDSGENWRIWRGADWRLKIRELTKSEPYSTEAATGPTLREDYVTCLAEDLATGRLYIGHHTGVDVVAMNGEPKALPVTAYETKAPIGEISNIAALVCVGNGQALMGAYRARKDNPMTLADNGAGGIAVEPLDLPGAVAAVGAGASGLPAPPISSTPPTLPTLPLRNPPTTLADLNRMRLEVERAVQVANLDVAPPPVTVLDDDWLTRGDWQGRYGRYWACLAAMASPQDYVWQVGWQPVGYGITIGPHHPPGDVVRYWMHWMYTTDPNSLEMPTRYLKSRIAQAMTTEAVNRRQSEVDDHGEVYPPTMEGPNLYVTVAVPSGGPYILSLYDFNKDGHAISAARRDYRVSVRLHPMGALLTNVDSFPQVEELAKTRITQFHSGVWKRFLVTGPRLLTVELNRHYSNDTILAGITLDLLDEKPAPYFSTPAQWEAAQAARKKSPYPAASVMASGSFTSSAQFLDLLEAARVHNPSWWCAESKRYYAALASYVLHADSDPKNTINHKSSLASCYYALGLYGAWEDGLRQQGITPARDLEKRVSYSPATAKQSGAEIISALARTKR